MPYIFFEEHWIGTDSVLRPSMEHVATDETMKLLRCEESTRYFASRATVKNWSAFGNDKTYWISHSCPSRSCSWEASHTRGLTVVAPVCVRVSPTMARVWTFCAQCTIVLAACEAHPCLQHRYIVVSSAGTCDKLCLPEKGQARN